MSTPLFLLLGLTLATCVIAYWSDNLGKKLGKKRVTMFGLRPRQTATFITMASSVCIMLFTFAALLAANSSLRGALLHYNDLRANNKELAKNNRALQREQGELQGKVTKAQDAVTKAHHQEKQAKDQARQATDEYVDAQKQLVQKQKELGAARSAAETARSRERTALSGERAAEHAARQVRGDLSKKQRQLNGVNSRLSAAQIRLTDLQRQLTRAQKRVTEVQKKAFEQGKKALEQNKELLARNHDLQTKISEQTKAVDGLIAQKSDLDSDIKRLEFIQLQLAQPSQGKIDVPEGEPFASRLIQPRTGASQIATQLRAMLAEGQIEVARVNPQRSIMLLLKTGEEMAQDKIITELTQYLAGKNSTFSVRLSALRNHVKDETEIQCAFLVLQARPAFARDEVMARAVMDGSQSDARIFNQMLRLLDAGDQESNDRDVRPLLLNDQKLYTDGTNEKLFEALRRIQAAGKPVEVRLIAEDDLSTIDQLRVRFEVGSLTVPIASAN